MTDCIEIRVRWWANVVRFDGEPTDAVDEDPDAFTKHGGEFALDRWADDGGRA